MGQFKPMVKMMTTEPSVILKLKKGGHVNMKDDACEQDGHSPMRKGLTVAIAVGKPRGGGAEGASPGKPSMSERRKAMAAPFMSKKGGKVMKKADGGMVDPNNFANMPAGPAQTAAMRNAVGLSTSVTPADHFTNMPAGPAQTAAMRKAVGLSDAPTVPTPRVRPPMRGGRGMMGMAEMKKGGSTDMAQDKAMIRKAMGQHDAQEHKGGKGTKLALKGGGNASAFANTKMHDGDKTDHAKGTGGVRTGTAGYKNGGSIAPYVKTKMHDGDHYDSAKGTGGVKMANSGGYKSGGSIDWANRPANTSKPGMTGTSTAGVRNGNAGGYKMGGAAKKAYATGGSVDTGRPVAYASKPASKPVSNTAQSGTFKKGGKVTMKADGGHAKKVSKQLADISRRPKIRALNELREGFGPSEHQALDAPRMSPTSSFTDPIRMRKAMAIPGRGGDYANKAMGGKVTVKADGGPMVDRSRGAHDKAIGPDESDMDMARSIRSAPGKAYDAIKRLVTRDPGAGAGRGFVNPPMARKKGGVMCKADGGMIGPDDLPQGMPGAGVPAGMPTGMPPMGMPTMANQPSLAAQQAMQKVLGTPDTGGLSGYKRGGSAKRVHRHTSAALRAMQ